MSTWAGKRRFKSKQNEPKKIRKCRACSKTLPASRYFRCVECADHGDYRDMTEEYQAHAC